VAIILNIETAVDSASVCLARNGEVLTLKTHPHPRDTASWIQPSILEIFKEQDLKFSDLHAVAVSAGPGSYTGLRVGMASAKGLCFALKIPLILVSTLKIIATACKKNEGLLCPMIDARRMEVFTAVFDKDLNEIEKPCNMILNDQSFAEMLETSKIFFFGNGSKKFSEVTKHKNAVFLEVYHSAADMSELAQKAFDLPEYSDLAYAEPSYGKEFFSPAFRPSA
jgi:tRNA threonylcarbamoyladenosine biosynthesis protein TsaB